jgi:hypothetical protein
MDRTVTCQRPDWGYAIPWMFRAIADPTSGLPMPAKPDLNDHLGQLGYWTALAHLLCYCFGWLDLGRGLSRWMLQGQPPSPSAPVQLLSAVWTADGDLGRFHEWADTLSASMRLGRPPQTGYDPYLLAAHLGGPLVPPTANAAADGVLFLDTMVGWHCALNRQVGDGPFDVIVRAVGWLGCYQRSPSTGLWHCVDDATHLLGQPAA